jgi:hypothetical protein
MNAQERIDSPFDESRSWPEDFEHENGNYCCKCCQCGKMFTGHKRRVVCRVCATKAKVQSKPTRIQTQDAYRNFQLQPVAQHVSRHLTHQQSYNENIIPETLGRLVQLMADRGHISAEEILDLIEDRYWCKTAEFVVEKP